MYRSYIGLEIHVQLLTRSKVFCGCRASFGDEPNTNVCPVCMGYPGVLPALNESAIEMGYALARALNCELADVCMFDRKNYFYPDLPKNYQISQFNRPLGRNGWIDLETRKQKKRVRIHEIHLEEDAGKMIHAGDMSLLDYNRAGTPLLEIVTEPDLEIGEEAEALLLELRRIVRYLGVCDGNMEEGSMRCDANVSVNVDGAGLGSKVEIKNLNSSRFVRKALSFEIARQEEILERGGNVTQETRLWNENRDLTESMRVKESAHDYRYFPEPDMPVFRADEAFLARVEARQVELPADRRHRFMRDYHLSRSHAEFLCDERATADWFEAAAEAGADPEQIAIWLSGDVRKQLNRRSAALEESPLTPARLAELIRLLADGTIHGKIAKQTLVLVFDEDKDPAQIIREQGWEQITDPAQLTALVDEVLAANPQAVEQIRGGDSKPLGFLVGKVMAASDGRAEPRAVQSTLRDRLDMSPVVVLSFGGAIAGRRREDGLVEPGDLMDLRVVFANDPELPNGMVFEEVQLGRFLSEEVMPEDWAALIERVRLVLDDGSSRGVVVGHGTDTLPYTASLLHWFFADAAIPIVLTASAVPDERGGRGEAVENLRTAIRTAAAGDPGLHVVYGDADFVARNLKFERAGYTAVPRRDTDEHGEVIGAADQFYAGEFRTWNGRMVSRAGRALATGARTLPRADLTRILETALKATHVAKVYPGMRSETLIALIDAGVRFVVLELYDTGTANLRESPFSLRRALEVGRERGVRFFCTSQQEGVVDFSEYVTGHAVWREGAIPMGILTTESVFTLLLAAQAEAIAEEGDASRPASADRVVELTEDLA